MEMVVSFMVSVPVPSGGSVVSRWYRKYPPAAPTSMKIARIVRIIFMSRDLVVLPASPDLLWRSRILDTKTKSEILIVSGLTGLDEPTTSYVLVNALSTDLRFFKDLRYRSKLTASSLFANSRVYFTHHGLFARVDLFLQLLCRSSRWAMSWVWPI